MHLIFLTLCLMTESWSSPVPINLLTNLLLTPLGIDIPPTFTWRLPNTKSRNQPQQTHYQIQVLLDNTNVTWDSDSVLSHRSTNIQYTGPQLQADSLYSWRVRVTTATAHSEWSDYSKPANFVTGFFSDDDWGNSLNYGNCALVDENQKLELACASPSGIIEEVLFASFGTPQGDCDTGFKKGTCDSVNSLQVVNSVCKGKHNCTLKATNDIFGGDPCKETVKHLAVNVKCNGSSNINPRPKWISGGNVFRKEFALPKSGKLSRAIAFVSGVGYYELYINGKKVGDHVLDPAWTPFAKEQLYVAYDVTQLIPSGLNAVGIMVGNGWHKNGHYPNPAAGSATALLKFNMHMDDGSIYSLVTDKTWTTCQSPITDDSVYDGEKYNALLEQPGWATATFKPPNGTWTPATEGYPFGKNYSTLKAQIMPPIRVQITIPAVTINKTSTDTYVVDFGQNIAGWVKIKVKGKRGQNVTLRHAELLTHPPYGDHDGSIYVGNLRSAKATDVYTLRGDPQGEEYEPRFTYHGFRYLEVTGLGYKPDLSDIQAQFVHSDVGKRSQMQIQEQQPLHPGGLLNRIHENVVWGALSNMMGVPTDCPQRDERRGWMGDAALAAELEQFNFFSGGFHANYLREIALEQSRSGGVPAIVPGSGDSPDPSWSTAFPTIAFELIRHEGDLPTVQRYYAQLVKYMDWLESKEKSSGLKNMFAKWADWCPAGPKANVHMVSSGTYLHDLKNMAQVALHLNQMDDAKKWNDTFNSLVTEFNSAFLGDISTEPYGGQTGMAIALWLDIVPASDKSSVLQRLVDNIINQHSRHLDTGIVGTRYLFEALVKHGRMDVAMDIGLQTTEPSYGYQIVNKNEPATTVWELWNGDSQGPGMNSRNHIMFGTVDTWLYKHVVGLSLTEDAVEFDKIIVKPDAALLKANNVECAIVDEGQQAMLTCGGGGGTIEQILFASFGTPSGNCGNISSLKKGSCHSNTSLQIIESNCQHAEMCKIVADDTIFGDPCYGTKKQLAVAIKCSAEGQGIPIPGAWITTHTRHGDISVNWTATATAQGGRVVTISLSVPPGTVSTAVYVPNVSIFAKGSSLEIEESDKVVWQSGKFVPGVPGITSGQVSTDNQFVVFHITTGVYEFKSSSK